MNNSSHLWSVYHGPGPVLSAVNAPSHPRSADRDSETSSDLPIVPQLEGDRTRIHTQAVSVWRLSGPRAEQSDGRGREVFWNKGKNSVSSLGMQLRWKWDFPSSSRDLVPYSAIFRRMDVLGDISSRHRDSPPSPELF